MKILDQIKGANTSTVGARLSRGVATAAILASGVVIGINAAKWPFSSNGTVFRLLYAAGIGVGAVTYLLSERSNRGDTSLSVSMSDEVYKIQGILCFICISLILLVLDGAFYVKPTAYYVLVAIWGASLIGVTAVGQSGRKRWWHLGQTVLLGVILLGSSQAINPFLTGADAYWHYNGITHAIDNSILSDVLGHYFYYFIFHSVSSTAIQLAGGGTTVFSLLTVVWGLAIVPSLYVLVRHVEPSSALVSTQLLVLNPLFIFGIVNKSPTYLGLLFAFLAVYIVLRSPDLSITQSWGSFLLMALGAFFIHIATSIALAVFLAIHYLSQRISTRGFEGTDFRKLIPDRVTTRAVIAPFFSYVVAMIAYHVFVHTAIFNRVVSTIFSSQTTGPAMISAPQTLQVSQILQYGFGFLALNVLVLLATIGSLRWVASLGSERIQLVLWVGLLNLLAVGYLFLGPQGPTLRLVFLLVTIAVIPAGKAIDYIPQHNHLTALRAVFLLGIILVAATGPASYLTWDGNDVYNDEIDTPEGFVRSSTVVAHDYLSSLRQGSTIAIDGQSAIYILNERRGLRAKPDQINVTCIDCRRSDPTNSTTNAEYIVINEPRWENKLLEGTAPRTGRVYSNGDVFIDRVAPSENRTNSSTV